MSTDYNDTVCPFCELPIATQELDDEYQKRLDAVDDNENDPALVAWAAAYCWFGWQQPGACRQGMSVEDRLIEVLGQRDEARMRVAELEAFACRVAAEPSATTPYVSWDMRVAAKQVLGEGVA